MKLTHEMVEQCRSQFPALKRRVGDNPAVFLDGPAGTQVPERVIDAIREYLSRCNANHGGLFATSVESDRWLDDVHQAVADLLGANDPSEVLFGANMTSLTFAISRALARTWKPNDEVVVTRSEHDANFTPWVLAARDAGAIVRYVEINPSDCTLDMEDFRKKINSRTRLVAVGCASNASGTINPVETICDWARDVGALSFLDAVHYAPHRLIDVEQLGCDLLACSAYKFFGPHVGIMWGRRNLLESLQPYKLRPSSDDLPGRWMTGTQNHECLAGTKAAIDYLDSIGRMVESTEPADRRASLCSAFEAIGDYERSLVQNLLDGLQQIDGIKVWGITNANQMSQRVSTVSLTHARLKAEDLAQRLGEVGFFVWHGNYYALPLTEALGVEPDGMVRVGLLHYNTAAEVQRFLEALRTIVS